MANSGTVTAGSAALASQYNNLRDDVLNITTGHTHTGASENGAKVAATGVSSGTAANGAVLTANGSGAAAFLAASASGGILKYEEFTSSGSFVIPANASSSAIVVVEIGDGGEGGRGGNKQVGVQSTGGAGGAMVTYYDLLSSIGTAGGTATVTIGAGGAGGAGATAGGRGVRGVVGGYSSIGNLATKAVFAAAPAAENDGRYSPQVLISGVSHSQYTTGMQDTGGTVAGGTVFQTRTHTNGGNAYVYNTTVNEIGVMGQDSDFNGAAGGGGADSPNPYVAYSGGHGGKRWGYRGGHFVGVDASNRALITVGNGVAGGAGASGGGSAGTAATAGSGGGGGGGGNANSGNGGAGGAGAAPGGGGGAGGGSWTGNGGAGGAGGAGRVRVWVIG